MRRYRLRLITLLPLHKMPNFDFAKETLAYHNFLQINTETNTDLLAFRNLCSKIFKCQKSIHVEENLNGNKHEENAELKKRANYSLLPNLVDMLNLVSIMNSWRLGSELGYLFPHLKT